MQVVSSPEMNDSTQYRKDLLEMQVVSLMKMNETAQRCWHSEM
jgi:hypothetical protein